MTDHTQRSDSSLGVRTSVPTSEHMRVAGEALGAHVRAGDVVLLDGGLGAGKTTFTQGIGRAMGVRGPVTSPTFVIARRHPPESGGLSLVHVDAYRLASWRDLEDLDLGEELTSGVTVVEWGSGRAEPLSDSFLRVLIERPTGEDPGTDEIGDSGTSEDAAAGRRELRLVGHGPAWPETRTGTVRAALSERIAGVH